MNENASKTLPVAPYIPLATLLNFIGKVKNTVLPPRIDGSLAQSMSGGMRGALMSTLRFLSLIDKGDIVQDRLKNLVAAYQADEWKAVWGEVVESAYAEIIGDLDITTSTQAMLEEKFKTNTGGSGQVLEKGVRFYIAALSEAGKTVSPHLKSRKTRSNGSRKTARKPSDSKNAPANPDPSTDSTHKHPPGTKLLRLQVPGKEDVKFYIPEDLTADDWTFLKPIFEAYINRILSVSEKTT